MKRRILKWTFRVYTTLLRLVRAIRPDGRRATSALILPPSEVGSLGDEAMLNASADYLTGKGVRRIGLAFYGPVGEWQNPGPFTEIVEPRCAFYASWRDKFHFARIVARYDTFFCLGGDVMDGYYSNFRTRQRIELLSIAAKTGARAAILGFSFNNQPTPQAVQAFRSLPATVRICARDPISQERLIRYVQRPVELVADLAFLLRPAAHFQTASTVLRWVSEERAGGRTIIGINANQLNIREQETSDLVSLVQIYTDTLIALFQRGNPVSFVLMHHDSRGEHNDIRLAELVLQNLSLEIQTHCIQIPATCTAAEIKHICGSLDIALSGRMHLAIACLGQGTPVVCITYQDKFEGLFRHFELTDMTINPAVALQPGELARFLWPLIEGRETIRQQIVHNLPRVQQLARANFDAPWQNARAANPVTCTQTAW